MPHLQKVLLVDDNPIDNFVSRKMVEKSGIANEIFTLTSAMEALDYLRAHQPHQLPDVIFLDINMPIMSGFDFLEEFIKLDPAIQAHCRIFVLSSSTDSLDRERANQNPFVQKMITKPLEFNFLQTLGQADSIELV